MSIKCLALFLNGSKEGDAYVWHDLHNPNRGQRWPTKIGDWEQSMYFDLMPWNLDEVQTRFRKIIYEKHDSHFNLNRLICGTNQELDKFVAISNWKLLIDGKERTTVKKPLESDESVCAAIAKYFPGFPVDVASASYKEWHCHDEQKDD